MYFNNTGGGGGKRDRSKATSEAVVEDFVLLLQFQLLDPFILVSQLSIQLTKRTQMGDFSDKSSKIVT